MIRAAVLTVLAVLTLPLTALGQGESPRASHRGVDLYTVAPDAERNFDVSIVPPEKGVEAMRAALDLLLSRSYLSANAIASLQKHGRVILVYDPNYPDKGQMLGYTVAGFFPKYFRERGDFLVRIGRHGIKWPAKELAAVIAHELAGHGMQEARGERERMRSLDRECEAWLYEEQAYQDLGVDKSSKPMIEFRKQLEQRECSDFRRYQSETVPVSLRLWEARNPNVTSLLVVFRQYLKATGAESGLNGRRG